MTGAVFPGVLILAAAVAFAVPAGAQDRAAARKGWAELERYDELQRKAGSLFPRRRDAPMRDKNINDEEVREIQSAALAIAPRALVNIGAVTTGCPCEDGGGCKDQVWIVATGGSRSMGLQLSRIDGRWVVGPVQQWWLRYAELQRRRSAFKDYAEFMVAERKVLDDLPVCSAAGAAAETAIAVVRGR